MLSMAFRICVYVTVFCFLLVQIVSGHKVLTFKVNFQTSNCEFQNIELEKNEALIVHVLGVNINYKEFRCSTNGQYFLSGENFSHTENGAIVRINNTEPYIGTWTCVVPKRPDVNYNGNNTTKVICSPKVNLKVPPPSPKPVHKPAAVIPWVSPTPPTIAASNNNGTSGEGEKIAGLDKNTFYIIVGTVVVIIFIAQTCIIIYYRSRINRRSRLSNLERSPPPRDDTARYSTNPLRKGSRGKRASSGIYQSLENLRSGSKTPPNIKHRPPMPLPMFCDSDDDSEIYRDGNTLTRMFTPEPPSIDSLPRHAKKANVKSKQTPKAKPVQDEAEGMENYDYADTDGPVMKHRQLFLTKLVQKRAAESPIRSETLHKTKPRPVIASKPLGAAVPVVNELDNIFKKRNQNARAEPSGVEPAALNLTAPRKPAVKEQPLPLQKVPALRSQPERDIRPRPNAWTPKPAVDPRPAQSIRSTAPRFIEDQRASEDCRQDIRPKNLRVADRFEDKQVLDPRAPLAKKMPEPTRAPQTAMVLPMQMMKSPPLPRKPGQDVKPPVPGHKPGRQFPQIQDTESVYEPVAEGDSTDDEEWDMEPLKPYNIYNI